MSKRSKIYVNPNQGKWSVKREGAERASRNFNTKEEAVKFAKQVAKQEQPSQVIIKKLDGTIQTEHTYSDDPCPPKG